MGFNGAMIEGLIYVLGQCFMSHISNMKTCGSVMQSRPAGTSCVETGQ